MNIPMSDKAELGPPFCVVGKCQRRAKNGDWMCKECGDLYGDAPIDPTGERIPWVGGLKPAKVADQ